MRHDLISLIQKNAGLHDRPASSGITSTAIDGLRLFWSYETQPRSPVLYDPGVVIIAQGSKTAYLGDRAFHYDANTYLVPTVPMPLECETHASRADPVLGLVVDIDHQVLYQLINDLSGDITYPTHQSSDPTTGIGRASMGPEMEGAAIRLLRCLDSTADTQILSRGITREILYRALLGERGSALLALAQLGGQSHHITTILKRLHHDYNKPVSVSEMAREAGMSVSTFNRTFMRITNEPPLRYLKKVRLNIAKSMIETEGTKVNIVAIRVGYESTTQFSREFKRLFGLSPSRVREMNLPGRQV